ncbi:MAG: phosphohydrolase, partial [Bacteroidales bacterium]|nr:phosphohydrolase [Bacteroidales bacterium]
VARRLMYWQVYLHKTVLAAEYMLRKVLQRARYLLHNGDELAASAALYYFLKNDPAEDEFREDEELLKRFAALDDFDIFMALKQWQSHPDTILSFLSQSLVNRRLFRVELSVNPFDNAYVEQVKEKIAKKFLVEEPELNFLFIHEITSNSAYSRTHEAIRIVYADGRLCDATEASDQLNISALAHPVTKYFVCYPKGLEK